MYNRIKDLREDADKLQKEIAADLDTNVTQYRRYESGEREPQFEFIIKLAEYHNVSLDYIAGRTNDKKGLSRSDLSDIETELIKKFRELNEQQRGIIIGRIEAMKEENDDTEYKNKGVI